MLRSLQNLLQWPKPALFSLASVLNFRNISKISLLFKFVPLKSGWKCEISKAREDSLITINAPPYERPTCRSDQRECTFLVRGIDSYNIIKLERNTTHFFAWKGTEDKSANFSQHCHKAGSKRSRMSTAWSLLGKLKTVRLFDIYSNKSLMALNYRSKNPQILTFM